MINKLRIIFFLIFLFSIGCFTLIPSTSTSVTEKNIAAIYNPSSTTIHPKFFVYNKDSENSLLYIHFYTPELLFLQTGANKQPSAKVKIYYKIIQSLENEELIDSATTYLTITKNAEQTSLVTFLKLKPVTQEKYVIQVLVKDEYRKKSNIAFIEVDKSDKFGEQNFIVSYESDLKPTFANYIYSDQKYIIEFNQDISKLYVSYFPLTENLPLPPFSTKFVKFEYPEPDSIWTLNYSENALFSAKKPGIYFFQADTSVNSGKAMIYFGDEFPTVEKPATLIEPIEYLTTSFEYDDLKEIESNKIAIDYFWLQTNDNIIQAKELIRIFYNRVMFANIYFTSDREGWKTDRGMIYVVFGPPKIVNTKDGYEKWIYSDSKSTQTVEFEFLKRENKFTEKDYVLQRSVSLKNYWQTAVETWLEGKIYTLDY